MCKRQRRQYGATVRGRGLEGNADRVGPGHPQPHTARTSYPVLPLGDDRLVQNNFNPRRADRGALDRVSPVLLGRRVLSQTARLAMLRDRLNAAEDAVVGAIAIDRICLSRQMRPDRARNPVFNLGGGNADDRSGILLASRPRRPRHIVSPAPPALGRMARAHPVSAIIIELAREEGGGSASSTST